MIAKTRYKDPETRSTALRKLAEVTPSQEQSYGVTGEILSIVDKEGDPKYGDPFVRIEAIRALGKIQQNANTQAKTKYVPPLKDILKDTKVMSKVRKAVLEIFGETLDKDALPDQEAFKAVLDIAADKREPNLAFRGEAILTVGSFASIGDGLPALSALLNEQEPLIKEFAAQAIFMLLEKEPSAAEKMSVPTVNKFVELLSNNDLSAELRIGVMKVLAQLMREGNRGAERALETILDIVKNSPDVKMVIAGIESLGIIGTAQAVGPLAKAYTDFKNDDKNPGNEKEVSIRQAVMKALRTVLTTQHSRPTPDPRAVKESAALLVQAVDFDPNDTVKTSAVFSLAYLYPVKFQAEHQEAAEALIFLLRATKNEDLKSKIPDTLEAITNVNFSQDAKRWLEWFGKKYQATRRQPPPPEAPPPAPKAQ